MDRAMNFHLSNIQSQNPVQSANENIRPRQDNQAGINFRDMLAEKMTPVHFSKHAATRLNDRNINISGEQMDRLVAGIGKASQKGIRDSLVLVDDLALVVNVTSRTVITAISGAQDNVFSNIDGAVIV